MLSLFQIYRRIYFYLFKHTWYISTLVISMSEENLF